MVNTNQTEGKQNLYYYLSGIWEVLYDDDYEDDNECWYSSLFIEFNMEHLKHMLHDGWLGETICLKQKNQLSKIQMHKLGVLVLSKSVAEIWSC